MRTNYLLPVSYKKVGWFMFIPFLLWGISYLVFGEELIAIGGSNAPALFDGFSDTQFLTMTKNDSWTDEIIVIGLTIAMLFIGFSREKDEDECIATVRMKALVWAIMVNSILLIAGTLLIYGMPYLNFMVIFMFSLLGLFIIRYTWKLYIFRKTFEI